jgi:hypothetical protein
VSPNPKVEPIFVDRTANMIAKQQPAASLSGSARLLVELNGLNGWLAAIRFATSEADSPLA